MYKVIEYFDDLQDGGRRYNVGDTYPRKGFEVLPSRIKELSTGNNRRGIPLIELVEEDNSTADIKPKTRKTKTKE